MAQLGARLDGIEEVVGSNPIGSTKIQKTFFCVTSSFSSFNSPFSEVRFSTRYLPAIRPIHPRNSHFTIRSAAGQFQAGSLPNFPKETQASSVVGRVFSPWRIPQSAELKGIKLSPRPRDSHHFFSTAFPRILDWTFPAAFGYSPPSARPGPNLRSYPNGIASSLQ